MTPRSLRLDGELREMLARARCEALVVSGPHSSKELARLWASADGAILGLDEVDAAALQAAPRLRVVSRYGVGFDRIDLGACTRAGVAVTITLGTNQTSVAELTFGLVLALARDLGRGFLAGRGRSDVSPRLGIELAGKVLGIVGMGRVGRAVAERACAFNMSVLYTDPRKLETQNVARLGARRVTLNELLASADVVSLHAPLDEQTRGLLSDREFGLLRPGALLVNTARGELVDEVALLRALESGQLGGAALDVRIHEPTPVDDPIANHPNVLVTPHVAGKTEESSRRMAEMAVMNLLAVKRGDWSIEGLVNPEIVAQPTQTPPR